MAVVELTQTDSSKFPEVSCGDTIVFRLDETPASGFLWSVENANEDIIAMRRSDFIVYPSFGVGGGGQRVMTFEARLCGRARLHFKLWRAWGGEVSDKNQFDIIITVQN